MTHLADEAVEAAFREANRRLRDDELSMHDTRRILAAALPHLEGATPEWTDEERGFVETALAAADAGNAGHWPTVATYLAAEVRRLRTLEGATPVADRDVLRSQIIDVLHNEGAYCGTCDYEGECSDCDRMLGKYADSVMALIGAPAIDREALTAALGWVDNALRNGSSMTRANLAFEVLCRQLGVDRDSLNTSDATIVRLRSELTGGAS